MKRHISEQVNGSLDYLVNNAGRNYTISALDVGIPEVEATFEPNIFSVTQLCQAFAPILIQAKGTIIQICSVAAATPYAFGSAYNASKAALHAYSDTLRNDLTPFGDNVIVVVTGGVKSNIARAHRELSKGYLYLPLNAYNQRRQLQSQEDAMKGTLHAERVVKAALGTKSTRSLWSGHQAWNVWLLLALMPRRFWDYYFSRAFILIKLARLRKVKRKKM